MTSCAANSTSICHDVDPFPTLTAALFGVLVLLVLLRMWWGCVGRFQRVVERKLILRICFIPGFAWRSTVAFVRVVRLYEYLRFVIDVVAGGLLCCTFGLIVFLCRELPDGNICEHHQALSLFVGLCQWFFVILLFTMWLRNQWQVFPILTSEDFSQGRSSGTQDTWILVKLVGICCLIIVCFCLSSLLLLPTVVNHAETFHEDVDDLAWHIGGNWFFIVINEILVIWSVYFADCYSHAIVDLVGELQAKHTEKLIRHNSIVDTNRLKDSIAQDCKVIPQLVINTVRNFHESKLPQSSHPSPATGNGTMTPASKLDLEEEGGNNPFLHTEVEDELRRSVDKYCRKQRNGYVATYWASLVCLFVYAVVYFVTVEELNGVLNMIGILMVDSFIILSGSKRTTTSSSNNRKKRSAKSQGMEFDFWEICLVLIVARTVLISMPMDVWYTGQAITFAIVGCLLVDLSLKVHLGKPQTVSKSICSVDDRVADSQLDGGDFDQEQDSLAYLHVRVVGEIFCAAKANLARMVVRGPHAQHASSSPEPTAATPTDPPKRCRCAVRGRDILLILYVAYFTTLTVLVALDVDFQYLPPLKEFRIFDADVKQSVIGVVAALIVTNFGFGYCMVHVWRRQRSRKYDGLRNLSLAAKQGDKRSSAVMLQQSNMDNKSCLDRLEASLKQGRLGLTLMVLSTYAVALASAYTVDRVLLHYHQLSFTGLVATLYPACMAGVAAHRAWVIEDFALWVSFPDPDTYCASHGRVAMLFYDYLRNKVYWRNVRVALYVSVAFASLGFLGVVLRFDLHLTWYLSSSITLEIFAIVFACLAAELWFNTLTVSRLLYVLGGMAVTTHIGAFIVASFAMVSNIAQESSFQVYLMLLLLFPAVYLVIVSVYKWHDDRWRLGTFVIAATVISNLIFISVGFWLGYYAGSDAAVIYFVVYLVVVLFSLMIVWWRLHGLVDLGAMNQTPKVIGLVLVLGSIVTCWGLALYVWFAPGNALGTFNDPLNGFSYFIVGYIIAALFCFLACAARFKSYARNNTFLCASSTPFGFPIIAYHVERLGGELYVSNKEVLCLIFLLLSLQTVGFLVSIFFQPGAGVVIESVALCLIVIFAGHMALMRKKQFRRCVKRLGHFSLTALFERTIKETVERCKEISQEAMMARWYADTNSFLDGPTKCPSFVMGDDETAHPYSGKTATLETEETTRIGLVTKSKSMPALESTLVGPATCAEASEATTKSLALEASVAGGSAPPNFLHVHHCATSQEKESSAVPPSVAVQRDASTPSANDNTMQPSSPNSNNAARDNAKPATRKVPTVAQLVQRVDNQYDDFVQLNNDIRDSMSYQALFHILFWMRTEQIVMESESQVRRGVNSVNDPRFNSDRGSTPREATKINNDGFWLKRHAQKKSNASGRTLRAHKSSSVAHSRRGEGMFKRSSTWINLRHDAETYDFDTHQVVEQAVERYDTQNEKFVDEQFPHSNGSLFADWSDSDPDLLELVRTEGLHGAVWCRPEQLFPEPLEQESGLKPTVCEDGVYDARDVVQGDIGNCWLLSALSVLASRTDLLDDVVLDKVTNKVGLYKVRLFLDGEWKTIVVDDAFPCHVDNHRVFVGVGQDPHQKLKSSLNMFPGPPVLRKNDLPQPEQQSSRDRVYRLPLPLYCRSKQGNTFWMMLVEKAFAKYYGCYEALDGGHVHSALVDLTGGFSQLFSLQHDVELVISGALWSKLVEFSSSGCLIAAGSPPKDEQGNELEDGEGKLTQDKNGIVHGHAYSILRLVHEHDMNGSHRLLQLRDPWGTARWTGPWSAFDHKRWTRRMQERLNYRPQGVWQMYDSGGTEVNPLTETGKSSGVQGAGVGLSGGSTGLNIHGSEGECHHTNDSLGVAKPPSERSDGELPSSTETQLNNNANHPSSPGNPSKPHALSTPEARAGEATPQSADASENPQTKEDVEAMHGISSHRFPKALETETTADSSETDGQDGTFWISLEDFISSFKWIYVCRVFNPKEWYHYTCVGDWFEESAGGPPNQPLAKNNPQFVLSVDGGQYSSVFISISNVTQSVENNGSRQYPYMSLLLLDLRGKKLDGKLLVHDVAASTGNFKNTRDLSIETNLVGGRSYTIFPCLHPAGEEGSFRISIYSQHPCKVQPL